MQGKISENFKNVTIDLRKYGTQYTTVWEALNSLLLGNVGGILRIRKLPNELDGHYDRYLDYFWSENELGCTSQSIEFGKNLLDLDYYVKAYDIVNRVTYYGYETKGWWIFAHTNKISVTAEDSLMDKNKPTAGRTKAIHRRLELSFNLYLLLLFVGQNRASKSLLHITPDFPYLAVFSTNKTFEGQLKP